MSGLTEEIFLAMIWLCMSAQFLETSQAEKLFLLAVLISKTEVSIGLMVI